ncbi:MAG: PAS domain-containing protein [Alphaproteobacteria bacterium]|nr:PAS domain-containing protein [Alphaproteobacteria bacterium]
MKTGIVGIGASAGGLEALTELFDAMPSDTDLSFIVVQHMGRAGPSILDDLLSCHTEMPVETIKTGVIPERNTVYVIPPGSYVQIQDDMLILQNLEDGDHLHTPIDRFFESLAKDQGTTAYAVVLSGAGSDGTLGIAAIKNAGGVTIAQRSDNARFASMPASATATNLVDLVLRPRDIPAKLIQLEGFRRRSASKKNTALTQEIEGQLPAILNQLKANDSSGFHHYKPGTLVRRILRRMMILHVSSVADYIDMLYGSEAERENLLRDFLIGVTQFFRNPDTFKFIEQTVLPDLLKREQKEFRVWCPGCSSGEELLSLAILIRELQVKTGDRRSWKLFGTDIDPNALAAARRAAYHQNAMAPVSAERRKRFFEEDHGIFIASPELRNMCIFAPHNLLSDPPFSKVDLISCRNLMIYIDQPGQEEIMSRFHYALNPQGYLWLGPSENLSGDIRLFETVNRAARVFRREEAVAPLSSGFFNKSFAMQSLPPPREINFPKRSRISTDIETETEQAFLSTLAPPFVRINQHNEVLYASEAIRPLLRPAKGVPSAVLDDYFVEAIRMPLRLVLKSVRKSKSSAEFKDVMFELEGETQIYDLLARPLDEAAKSVLVSFQPVRLRGKVPDLGENRTSSEAAYESELAIARKRLAARERDYEMAEQELRANNEELLTMNEELQSSNEELETSREELQSVNEELETINAELIENNKALNISHSNLKNLLENTDFATLFIDHAGILKLFTPRSQDLFSVQERDVGRSIFDLANNLDYPTFKADVLRASNDLETIDLEVSTVDAERHFLVTLKPYRDIDGRIDGCVVSLVDITLQREQKRDLQELSQKLAHNVARLEAFYRLAPIGVGLHGADMRYVEVNEALATTIGLPVSQIEGRHPRDIVPDIWKVAEPLFREILETRKPVLNVEVTAPSTAKDQDIRTWVANYFPIETEGSDDIEIGVTAMEVTQIKRLEEALEAKKAELQDSGKLMLRNFEMAPMGITFHQGPDHVIVHANESARKMLGKEDPTGLTVGDIFPEHYKKLRSIYDVVYRTGKTHIEDEAMVDALNEEGHKIQGVFRRIVQPWYDNEGTVIGIVCLSLNVSELVAMRDANAKQSERLNSIIDALQAQIILVDQNGTVLEANKAVAEAIGKPKDQLAYRELESLASMEMEASACDALVAAVGKTLEGQATQYDDRIRVPDSGEDQRVLISVSPVLGSQKKTVEVVIAISDQTELLETTQRKDILVAELEHRVKNVIATIQAVAQFTAATTFDVETMVKELDDRLAAMARSHEKLTAKGWSSQTFREILETEVEGFAKQQENRIILEGDDVDFAPNTAILFGLAVHELLTNATKHGALSNQTGEVLIELKVKDGELLKLIWSESGGPEATQSERQGFGSLLLGTILPTELQASATLAFDKSGLRYELTRNAD